ncbi:hypothetical protein AVEN_247067-1 [Araneus ventricosus]|uniref:Uncharacterized protein n=1 Tax=Araneus ventricosus TaxID=182803 RepID=A0A4Y2RUG6_ARAVE|nr:hypothetical protein AVEN_16521-1 [Araneus ventricosus]GBN78588.1 hypothetical protein AVEN_215017-1 [Araneus ventricosus]GBN78595.1 hypothetical protein AVEN_247067-1 [Araneus ventricosus]
MTRTASELALSSPNFDTTPVGGCLTDGVRFNLHHGSRRGGPSLEFGTLQFRDFTTRPPRPSKQHEGHFGADLVILNRDQITRTTPELSNPLSKLSHRTSWRGLGTTYDLTCNSQRTADLQWNRASSLGPSGPDAETLPLGHRGRNLVTCFIHAILIQREAHVVSVVDLKK